MEKAFGTAPAPIRTKKAAARVALVDLKESSRALLHECFRQFGIETVLVSSGAAERVRQEKFEACVDPSRHRRRNRHGSGAHLAFQ